ncbi:MAG: hypothetical protein K5978_03605 [Campylobacter sp.]|nr:hypothetical protein [Campylobacter sp.]
MKKFLLALAVFSTLFADEKLDAMFDIIKAQCDNGDKKMCETIGHLYNDTVKDKEQSKIYFKKACDMGEYQACGFLGLVYNELNDKKSAIQSAKKACENNAPFPACLFLAETFLENYDKANFMKYAKPACQTRQNYKKFDKIKLWDGRYTDSKFESLCALHESIEVCDSIKKGAPVPKAKPGWQDYKSICKFIDEEFK